ncbi:MAG: Flp pilus assembly protein CpaB [Phycisphaerae bacterium]
MKWSALVLILLGLVAAVSAAVLVAVLRRGGGEPSGEPKLPVEVRIVKAAKALPMTAVVDSGSVATETVSRAEAPSDYVSPAEAVGKVLRVPMVEGQTFTKSCFVTEGSGQSLAGVLPEGKRAVCLSLSDYSSLEPLLYPGSVVDVLASFQVPAEDGRRGSDVVSRTLLEEIQVLAIEDATIVSAPEDAGEKSQLRRNERRLVTLMVDTRQAEALQLASTHGSISLAMRNPLDREPSGDRVLLSQLATEPLGTRPPKPSGVPEARPPTTEAVVPRARLTTTEAVVPGATWDVVIIRGAASEMRSFPLETALTEAEKLLEK